MSVLFFIYVAAFISTIVSAIGKCPLWVPVLLLSVAGLIQVLPVGR